MSWEQEIVDKYIRENGNSEGYKATDIANWAIKNGEYTPPPVDIVAALAQKLSRGLRNLHMKDTQGRSVRMMHCISNREGQTKMTLWYDMRTAEPDVMKRSFQQRREQNIADNYQLKVDCDSYNENYNTGEQIHLIFDYTDDLEELELIRKKPKQQTA